MKYAGTLFAILLFVAPSAVIAAEDGDAILGIWASEPNEVDGNAHLEVYKIGDRYSGKIMWLEKPQYNPDDEKGMAGQDKIDRENPDEALRTRPLMGLNLIEGFEYVGK